MHCRGENSPVPYSEYSVASSANLLQTRETKAIDADAELVQTRRERVVEGKKVGRSAWTACAQDTVAFVERAKVRHNFLVDQKTGLVLALTQNQRGIWSETQ